MRITSGFGIASLLIAGTITGCLEKSSPVADASAADVGATMRSDAAQPDVASTPSGKPLAEGCAANEECASGFCVDSVCCDSACDGQCETCNVAGTLATAPPRSSATTRRPPRPCTGAHTCSIAIPVLSLPACRLKTLQACKSNSDCASLLCETFYVDHDGDGYGESQTTLQLCEVDGAHAASRVRHSGRRLLRQRRECIPRADANTSRSADACGSWDYNCDGTIQGSQSGFITYGTVPVSECGTNVHGTGCGDSCTATIECH